MNLSRWLLMGTATLGVAACNGLVVAEPDAVESVHDAGPDVVEPDAEVVVDAAPPVQWELDVRDYDQTCTYNFDCQGVQQGPCRDCMCYDAAVNRRDWQHYWDDFNAEVGRTQCVTAGNEGQQQCAGICDDMRIGLCIAGACTVGDSRTLEADGYDRSCVTVEDCVAVDERLCDGGANCSAAIAKSAKAQFDADRAAQPACGTVPPFEDADCSSSLACDAGQCSLVFREVP